MHLFAGSGGGLLADLILGHNPIIAVEWEQYPCHVLRERASEGWFPDLEVWEGDIRMFDPSEYKGRVDCIHAGFPCQDISVAGSQKGIADGTRSNLYKEALRIADAVRPRYIFLENVAAIASKSKGYLEVIGKDLAEIGYDAVWTTLSAAEVGAAHKRDRWWCLAFPSKERRNSGGSDREERHVQDNEKRQHQEVQQERNERQLGAGAACDVFSNTDRCRCASGGKSTRRKKRADSVRCSEQSIMANTASKSSNGSGINCDNSTAQTSELGSDGGSSNVPNTNQPHSEGNERTKRSKEESAKHEQHCWGQAKPDMGGVVDAATNRLDADDWVQEESQVGRTTSKTVNRADRLKALGNGQVPLQAAVAFTCLMELSL